MPKPQKETITSIADEIKRELEDDAPSISAITFTLRSQIGELNNLLDTNFIVDKNSLEVKTNNDKARSINIDEKAILIKLYMIRYWARQIRKNLGASGVQKMVSINSDGHSIEYSRPTTTASEYRQLRAQELEELRKLVFDYKRNRIKPLQVVGQDSVDSDDGVEIAREADDFNRLGSDTV